MLSSFILDTKLLASLPINLTLTTSFDNLWIVLIDSIVISSKFLNGEFTENGTITVKGKLGKLHFTQKLAKVKTKGKDKVV